jgi:hypothetical protein
VLRLSLTSLCAARSQLLREVGTQYKDPLLTATPLYPAATATATATATAGASASASASADLKPLIAHVKELFTDTHKLLVQAQRETEVTHSLARRIPSHSLTFAVCTGHTARVVGAAAR